MKQKWTIWLVLGGMTIGAGCWAGAAELRPYNLPSQRAPLVAPERERVELPPPQAGIEEFRQRMRTLGPEERRRLDAGIRERLRQAVREGRMEEARYYERLCTVLQEMER